MEERSDAAQEKFNDFRRHVKQLQDEFEAEIRNILERIRQRKIEEMKKRIQQ